MVANKFLEDVELAEQVRSATVRPLHHHYSSHLLLLLLMVGVAGGRAGDGRQQVPGGRRVGGTGARGDGAASSPPLQ